MHGFFAAFRLVAFGLVLMLRNYGPSVGRSAESQ